MSADSNDPGTTTEDKAPAAGQASMGSAQVPSPRDTLLTATGRGSLDDAVAWLSEGHPVVDGSSPQSVLAALAALGDPSDVVEEAIREVTKVASKSDLDPTAVLFRTADIVRPVAYRRCLDALAHASPTRSLVGLTANAVLAAQHEDPRVVETLALMAGLTMKELGRRLGGGVPGAKERWTPAQIRGVWDVVDPIIRGTAENEVAAGASARPVELLMARDESPDGWGLVEWMRVGGIPYEVLLAQRAVGGAWGLHRNATSSDTGNALVAEICLALEASNIAYLRSKRAGGTSDLAPVSPVGKLAGVVTTDADGALLWSVIVSVANDAGTASRAIGRLKPVIAGVPGVAVVVGGSGWFDRLRETAELATDLGGHLYTDRSLTDLVTTVGVPPPTYDAKTGVDGR